MQIVLPGRFDLSNRLKVYRQKEIKCYNMSVSLEYVNETVESCRLCVMFKHCSHFVVFVLPFVLYYCVNHFVSVFLKWALPFLTLDMLNETSRGFSLK